MASISIQAARLEDVPAIAKISGTAFENDRQTEMKGYGKEPFDMEKYSLQSLPDLLQHPRCVVLKAVNAAGEVMGYCNWGFRGFAPDDMPVLEGRVQPRPPPASQSPPAETPATNDDAAPAPPSDDPIARLEALTNADMDAWMTEVMPEGARCIYIVGLSVSPRFQGQGVGSALLQWGTSFCDARGVFAWVHSSEGAWPVYQKAGFDIIRELDVDLDAYAPAPAPPGSPGGKWGHYVFRYMKYFPK